jgi:HlyD family secretion protein
MNNPGSLVLTISDLSVVEVVVQVDETDVPKLSLGDSGRVQIDAFPRRTFRGVVTEIGNSATRPPQSQQAGQQQAVDFEVVLTLEPTEAPLRPDLSATAEIVTEVRPGAMAVPIIALTVRPDTMSADASAEGSEAGDEGAPDDVEGVFLVSDGRATFRRVEVGIAGREYFEVLSGLAVGDTVVAGPYQTIRQLRDGDPVQRQEREPVSAGG